MTRPTLPALFNYQNAKLKAGEKLLCSTMELAEKIHEILTKDFGVLIPPDQLRDHYATDTNTKGGEWKFVITPDGTKEPLDITFYVNDSTDVMFELSLPDSTGPAVLTNVIPKVAIAEKGFKKLSKATGEWMTTKRLAGLLEDLANYIKQS